MKDGYFETVSDDLILNYHLMHPGGDSAPGDPNLAYFGLVLMHPPTKQDGPFHSFMLQVLTCSIGPGNLLLYNLLLLTTVHSAALVS